MYVVVKTIEKGKTFFCTVPISWVNGNMLYFPKSEWKSHRNKLSEPELDWTRYECVVKGKPFPKIEDALQQEKQICKFADTGEEEEYIIEKREKRAHPVTFSSEQKNYSTIMANIASEENDNTSESSVPTSGNSVQDCRPEYTAHEDFEETLMNENEYNEITDNAAEIDTNLYLTSSLNLDTTFKQLLDDNAKLHSKLDRVLSILENRVIMAPNSGNLVVDQENLDLGELNLPVKSVEEMNELNKKLLEDKNYFQRISNLLRKEFSLKAEWKKVAYILVDQLFERKLLTNYTWTGSSKAKSKQGFMSLIGINKLFYSIVKNCDNNYNQINHEDFFKNCVLKYSDLRAAPKKISRTSTPRTSAPKKKPSLNLELLDEVSNEGREDNNTLQN